MSNVTIPGEGILVVRPSLMSKVYVRRRRFVHYNTHVWSMSRKNCKVIVVFSSFTLGYLSKDWINWLSNLRLYVCTNVNSNDAMIAYRMSSYGWTRVNGVVTTVRARRIVTCWISSKWNTPLAMKRWDKQKCVQFVLSH